MEEKKKKEGRTLWFKTLSPNHYYCFFFHNDSLKDFYTFSLTRFHIGSRVNFGLLWINHIVNKTKQIFHDFIFLLSQTNEPINEKVFENG